MTIPDEAVQAAAKKIAPHTKPGEMVYSASIAGEALIAALPFLTGVKVKAGRSVCYVSKDGEAISDILDMPSDFIYDALKANRDGEPAPSPRAQVLEEGAKWHRDDGDYSTLIYSLRQDGYRKGEPSMINDVTVRIEKSSKSDANISDIAAQIQQALSSQPVAEKSAAARDVLAERRRQVEAECWTPKHDDQWQSGELSGAAACYALNGVTYKAPSHYPPRKVYAAVAEARRDAEKDMSTTREAIRMAIGDPKAPQRWPWDAGWWKPSDRRRNLVKAGALILAEIERLDRLPSSPGASE